MVVKRNLVAFRCDLEYKYKSHQFYYKTGPFCLAKACVDFSNSEFYVNAY